VTKHDTTNPNYKIKPELVTFYDIRSGNQVGIFYQSQAPHGASQT